MKRAPTRRGLVDSVDGAMAVEFAVIALVMIMTLLGVAEIGRVVWIGHDLQRAAEEAARHAFTGADDAAIEAVVDASLTGLAPASVSKSVAPETVDGVAYKTIALSYAFEPVVPLVPIRATITRRARAPM